MTNLTLSTQKPCINDNKECPFIGFCDNWANVMSGEQNCQNTEVTRRNGNHIAFAATSPFLGTLRA